MPSLSIPCSSIRLGHGLGLAVGLFCFVAASGFAEPAKTQQQNSSASPFVPTPVESTPPASGSGSLEDQLDGVMKLFGELKTQEGFSDAERFVTIDDQPQAQRQGARRARLLLGKFDAIKKMLPKPTSQFDGPLAVILLVIGRTFEASGENAEAVRVFERIVSEYPQARFEDSESKDPISKTAAEQIRWHKEKHPWVQPERSGLLSKMRAALLKQDKPSLAALIARTGFWSGPFQSEGGPDDPDRVLRQLEAHWPKSPLTVDEEPEPFSDPERQIFLKTSGWTGEHPEIYFIMEKVPGGWHFSAVAFATGKDSSEHEAASPAVASPHAGPSQSPAPAASPAPQPGASANR